MTMYAIFSQESIWRRGKLTEEDVYDLLEEGYSIEKGSEEELVELARKQNKQYVHLYDRKEEDYDQEVYTFLSTLSV